MTKLWVTLPGPLAGLWNWTAEVLSPPTEAMNNQKRVNMRMTENALGWLTMELALPDMDDLVSRDSRLSDMESDSFLMRLMAGC